MLSVARAEPAGRGALGEKYAFLVGVQEYDKNELRRLSYAEADVVELRRSLLHAGYRRENIVLLTHSEGARRVRSLPLAATIRKELKALLRDRAAADTVVVAFTGHGVQFKGSTESYFCPMDARLGDKTTLISFSEINKQLEQCRADCKLLIVDACRNDPQSDFSRSRPTVQLETTAKLQPSGSLASLLSCSSGERAYEHADLKNGVFFHFLIEGLQGEADSDGDQQIDVEELARFTKRRVSDFVRAEYGVRQTPELSGRLNGLTPIVSLSPVAAHIHRGSRLVKSGELELALAEYNAAIELDKKSARAFDGRGVLYLKQGNRDKAVADFSEAVRLDPSFAPAYRHRGLAYGQQEKYDLALADCNEVLRLETTSPTAFLRRAVVRIRRKEYDQVIADTTEAIRLDPTLVNAYVNRGCAYRMKRWLDHSLADYTKAVGLAPDRASVYSNRSQTYLAKKAYDKALADCDEAIRLDPAYALAYNNRALIYYKTGELDKAIADFSEALRLSPNLGQIYKNRSQTYQDLGNTQLAQDDSDKAEQVGIKPFAGGFDDVD